MDSVYVAPQVMLSDKTQASQRRSDEHHLISHTAGDVADDITEEDLPAGATA